MESVAIIKQLRKLKKAECHIRFRQKSCPQGKHLVWSDFFDDKDACNKSVKYNMNLLICLSHEQRKEVYALFYYQVYYVFYKESGMSILNLYDQNYLVNWGFYRMHQNKILRSNLEGWLRTYILIMVVTKRPLLK